MGAIVTTFYIENMYNKAAYCGLKRWCHTASWLARTVPGSPQQIVFVNSETVAHLSRRRRQRQDLRGIVERECPDARVLGFSPELLDVTVKWENRSDRGSLGYGCPGYGAPKTLLKWAAVDPRHYLGGGGGGSGRGSGGSGSSSSSSSSSSSNERAPETVLFLDSDVDAAWYASAASLRRLGLAAKLDAFARDAACDLCATPDHSTPVNTGVMLLKPSAAIYEEGLAVLRTLAFNKTNGFNHSGPVRQAIEPTIEALPSERARLRLRGSAAYVDNTWNFICGDADQGLFTTVYLARHRRFCTPIGTRPAMVHHFWASDKPWHDPPSCARYFAFLDEHTNASIGGTATNSLEESPCTRYLKAKRAKLPNRTRCRGRPWPAI